MDKILFLLILCIGSSCNSIKDTQMKQKGVSLSDLGANGQDKKDDTNAFNKAFANPSAYFTISSGDYYIYSSKLNFSLTSFKSFKGIGQVNIIDKDRGQFLTQTRSDIVFDNIGFQNFRVVIYAIPEINISCTLNNCRFKGNMKSAIASKYETDETFSLFVKDCSFDGDGNNIETKSRGAIALNSKIDTVSIKSSTFSNFVSLNTMARAIAITPKNKDGEFIHIENNTINNIQGKIEIQGIMVFGRNAYILNNKLSNITSEAKKTNECEGIYTKVQNALIKDNVLTNSGQREGGIVIKTYNKDLLPNITVADNVITFNEKSTGSKASGIVARHAYNLTIERNTIVNSSHIGIEITGSNKAMKNVVVANNKIQNSHDGGIILVGGTGVSSNINIKDNIIDGANTGRKPNFFPLRISTGVSAQEILSQIQLEGNIIKNVENCMAEIYIMSRFKKHNIENITIKNNQLYAQSEHKIYFECNDKIRTKTIGKGKIENVEISKNAYHVRAKNEEVKNSVKIKKNLNISDNKK